MASPDQIAALLVGANALGLAALMIGLWMSGRRINMAVLWLLLAVTALMALNLLHGLIGENTPLTRVRWGIPLAFGPLLAWYVRVDAGGEGPRRREVLVHTAVPVALTAAFAAGLVRAEVASWLVLAQVAIYLALIATMKVDNPALLRKRILIGVGSFILVINLLQMILLWLAPELDGFVRAALLACLAALIGLFVIFGLTDPAALFRRAAETVLVPRQPRLSDGEIAEINERIDSLFDSEQPYLDPEFSLERLAVRVGALPREVSLAVNSRRHMGVPELINQRRVEAVQRRLLDHGDNVGLLEIAFECGFRSKATFNRAFRRHADSTPRDARRAARPPSETAHFRS